MLATHLSLNDPKTSQLDCVRTDHSPPRLNRLLPVDIYPLLVRGRLVLHLVFGTQGVHRKSDLSAEFEGSPHIATIRYTYAPICVPSDACR